MYDQHRYEVWTHHPPQGEYPSHTSVNNVVTWPTYLVPEYILVHTYLVPEWADDSVDEGVEAYHGLRAGNDEIIGMNCNGCVWKRFIQGRMLC